MFMFYTPSILMSVILMAPVSLSVIAQLYPQLVMTAKSHSLKSVKILVQCHFQGNQPCINMVKLTINFGGSPFS